MKKILLTIFSLISLAAMAQSGLGDMQRGVGVFSGDGITAKDVGIGTEGTYQIAAMLDADDLRPYIGCDIVGIRFAMGVDVAKSNVFLYTVNGNTISEAVITQSARYPSEGWNNIFFNGGKKYTITGDEGLMFGFEYTETASMVASDQGAICINGDNTTGKGFFLYGNFGQGEGWYSSDTGNLCVQLIVDVSNMVPYDIAFTTFTAGHKYKKVEEGVDFLCSFTNAGRENILSADFSLLVDNQLAEAYHCENTKGDNTMTIDHRTLFPEALPIGEHTFTVRLDKINDQAVTNERSASESFVIYDATLGRQKHYVEQYMSQRSLFNQYTDVIMNEVANDEKVCLVNMYNTDGTLAVEGADQYIQRYAYDYPCFTVDRSYYPGELHVAYDVNYYAQVVPEIMVSVIGQIIDEQDLYPAFATVDIQPEYDSDSRNLNVQVSGNLIDGAGQLMGNNAVLTLMLIENDVAASQIITDMTGRNRTDKNYRHNHVLRLFVSSAEGDAIDLSTGSYVKNYSVTIPDDINPENVELVAIVSRGYEEGSNVSINNYDVTNCNSVALAPYLSGISDVTIQPHDLGTYNLQGQRINPSDAVPGQIVIRGGKKMIMK